MTVAGFADFLVDEFRDTVAASAPIKIGAFVGEPVQASGGVIVPPDGYLKRIREICRDNDILYISDEVVTAFGRLGHVFASGEVFGLDPDMITFAKGVTSGYFPLGGVVISGAHARGTARRTMPTPCSAMATPTPATRSAARWR